MSRIYGNYKGEIMENESCKIEDEIQDCLKNLKLEKESLTHLLMLVQSGNISCRRGASEILALINFQPSKKNLLT